MRRLHARPIVLFLALMALVVMVVPQALGEDLTGSGPDFAMTPAQGWVSIESGQYQWYVFKYDFDDKHGPMEVKLYTFPEEGAVLTLRNQTQAQLWRAEGKHEHFGCCTPVARDADKNGKGDYAAWSANLGSSGKYYMVVQHAANVSGPVFYRIELNGKDFSFTGAAAPVEAACAECADEVIVTPPELGSGPDLALALPGDEATLNSGEYRWYSFDYTRDSKTKIEDLRPIEIKIFSNPPGVATMSIRNAEEAAMWKADGTQESFGCCSGVGIDRDKDGKSDYGVWKGALVATGRYYVVVEHARNSSAPAVYHLEVSGL